jgi:AMP-polyphosphate phosphotransferase
VLAGGVGHGSHSMKSADFVVTGRPRLDAIKHFPVVELADYERRLIEMQKALQRVQQAYIGTSHRAIIVLEGWRGYWQ